MLRARVCVYCCSMTHYVKAVSELMLRAEWRSRLGVLLLFAFTFYGQAAVCFMTRLHLCSDWSLSSAILFCFGVLCNNHTAMLVADRLRFSSASFWEPFCCFQQIVLLCSTILCKMTAPWFTVTSHSQLFSHLGFHIFAFVVLILQIWTNCHPQQFLETVFSGKDDGGMQTLLGPTSVMKMWVIVCSSHTQLCRLIKGLRNIVPPTVLMSQALPVEILSTFNV